MVHLFYSNQTEALLDALVQALQECRVHPLELQSLVLPNRHLETYVRFGIGHRLGVALGLRFERLETAIDRALGRGDSRNRLLSHWVLTTTLIECLAPSALDEHPELESVHHYIDAVPHHAARDRRRTQLALQLSRIYQEYMLYRPDWIEAWRSNSASTRPGSEMLRWQEILFRRAVARLDAESDRRGGSQRWIGLDQLLTPQAPPVLLQGPLFVFGLSVVAPAYQRLLARLAENQEIFLFALNPCCEFWEDLETDREFRHRLKRSGQELRVGLEDLDTLEDPYGLFEHEDNLALRRWGVPGRESIRLLNEVTDCDFEPRFVDPGASTLLHQVQRNILLGVPYRAPASVPSDAEGPLSSTEDRLGDGSLVLVAAPSPRREVEWVMDTLFETLRQEHPASEPPVRFDEIALLLPAAAFDSYLPHLRTEAAARSLPLRVSDRPDLELEAAFEAVQLLLELPFVRLTRPAVLAVLTHPAWSFGDEVGDQQRWADLADELGIFFGADHRAFEGTYVDRDLLSWDQGVRRLVLGAFFGEGTKDGAFSWREQQYLPASSALGLDPVRLRFGRATRAVLGYCKEWHSGPDRSLSEWIGRLVEFIGSYLLGIDQETRDTVLRSLDPLLDASRSTPLSGIAATELTRSLFRSSLPGRGTPLSDGIVVSTLLPMRGIPFRRLHILGLGEGDFPAPRRRDPLDQRFRLRRGGDVTPEQRDRYAFLETLLSAREHLGISWSSLDQQTGEEHRPSVCVRELEQIVASLGSDGLSRIHLDSSSVGHRPRNRREWAHRVGAELASELGPDAGALALAEIASLPASASRTSDSSSLCRLLRVQFPPAMKVETTLDSVSSRQLAEFLKAPISAWAQVVGGLRSSDQDAPELQEEEHWKTPALELVVERRNAFATALNEGSDLAVELESSFRRLELAGRSSVGTLLDLELSTSLPLMESWQQALDLASDEPLALQRVQFHGSRATHTARDAATITRPAIELPVEVPEALASGTTLRVTGRTGWMLPASGTLVFLLHRPGTRQFRADLTQAYVDHLLLAASDHQAGRERTVLFCPPEQGPRRLRLKAISSESARDSLTALLNDLLRGPHDYLLPLELAFVDSTSLVPTPPDERELERRLAALKPKDRISGLAFSPIPNPQRYSIPETPRAVEMLRRRFGPISRSLKELA